MSEKVVCGQRSAGTKLDDGHGNCPEARVLDADNGGSSDLGVALQGGAHIVRVDFETAPNYRLVGPADDPQEPVGVQPGHVSGPDPRRIRAQLTRFDLKDALHAGLHDRSGLWFNDAQHATSVGSPDAAPFRVPECLVIRKVPTRYPAAELRRSVGNEYGCPVLGPEGVGIIGREGRRPGYYRAHTTEIVGVHVGLKDHTECSRHQTDGLGPVAANGVYPSLDAEPLEEGERAAVADTLEHSEETAQMHERGVDHGDTRSEAEVERARLDS